MDMAKELLLWAHIISGSLGLLLGGVAFTVKKGGPLHKLAGRVFFWSMLLCGSAGVGLSVFISNAFLLVIGLFTLYLTLAGYNFLRVKRSARARVLGTLIAASMALTIVALLILGLDQIQAGKPYGGSILLVFAGLASFLVVQDFNALRKGTFNPIVMHIGRIVGAWISAWSAFLVVNQFFAPPILNWLLPTVIGVPAIVYWIRKTKKP